MPRPNLLVVMFEQIVGQVFAEDGPDLPVDLPNWSHLCQESVCFEHAHCNAPVCGPSRLSFLTGRYPHRCQGYDNGSILPAHIPTFGHMLTLGGYRTAMCGRMHIHGLDTHRGFEQRLSSEIINPLLCLPADQPGQLVPIRRPGPEHHENTDPVFVDDPIYDHDEYVTDQACRFLAEQGQRPDDSPDGDSPFALVVGYAMAHSGFASAPQIEPLYHKYMQRDLPVEPFTPADFDALPEHIQRLLLFKRDGAEIFDPEFHRRQLALYLARLEYADGQLGRVLAALDAAGRADDTVVVATADHGESMGRHGIWGKMNFYEQAQRIPLTLRAPGIPQRTVRQPVSLVDCLPTFADFAGLKVDFPIDGHSLRPLMTGEQPEDPDAEVFSEYHGYLSAGAAYMLLRGSHKYCCYEQEEHELYDLSRDGDETCNRISDPAYATIRQDMRSRLEHYVNQPEVAKQIAEHNQQRDVVSRCLKASKVFNSHRRQRARSMRKALNEPWWDHGRHIGEYDPPQRQGAP